MRKLGKLLSDHFKEDLHIPYYITVILFIILGLGINYTIDLENSIIDKPYNNPWRILWYFLLYSLAYYGTISILYYFKKVTFVFDRRFWLISLTGIIVLAINTGFPFLYTTVRLFIENYKLASWAYQTCSNLISFLFITIPLLLISRYWIKDNNTHLGLNARITIKPYLQLLALIIPLISIAVFERGLGSYYPTYKSNTVAPFVDWPSWIPMVIYECAYAIDFFNVELFFRGFLVIGLSHLMGKETIIPMVTTYCFLHFGKPLGEAVSSVIGGYILGVIALYTRNIWGGVILHIGVAWTMEIAAWLSK